MSHQIQKQLWYILILLVLFYAVPAAYRLPDLTDTFRTAFEASMLIVYNPASVLAVSAVYGFRHGFKWYSLLYVPILYIPSVFLFYNDTALIYAAIYEVFALAGLGLGFLLKRGRSKKTAGKV